MNPEAGSQEDRFDSALQRVIEGAPVEDVMAYYGFLEGEESEALLRAASAIRKGPHPELPRDRLGAMVARAQEQARTQRTPLALDGFHDKEPAILLPPLVPATPPQRTAAGATAAHSSWRARLAAMINRSAPALRAASVLVVILALFVGGLILARMDRSKIVISYPQVSGVPFNFDGSIERITPNAWTVGGYDIEIDKATHITGNPELGAQAQVQGEVLPGNRRLARTIIIAGSPPPSATAVSAEVTATPTGLMEISGWPVPATRVGISPTGTLSPADSAPPTTATQATTAIPRGNTAVPQQVASTRTRTTLPISTSTRTATRSATRVPVLTRARTVTPVATRTSTRVPVLTRTTTPRPTNTALSTITATLTRVPTRTSTLTNTPVPTLTLGPSGTHTPVPTFSAGPTSQPSPTIEPTREPEDTFTPEPTSEPEDTRTPEPTETRVSTDTPGPRLTNTPILTATRVPTHTQEPRETETVPASSQTPQATETHASDGTQSPEPDETHGPEGTHGPQASPTHSDTP